MSIRGSRAVIVTVNSGLANVKVHAGELQYQVYTEDVSGDTDTQDVLYIGARQVRLVLTCSWTTSANALIFPGAAANLTLKLHTGGTAYTDDYVVIAETWSHEKRGGDQPQRFNLVLSPHAEAASNQTATDGVFSS